MDERARYVDLNDVMIRQLVRDTGAVPEAVAAALRAVRREDFVRDGFFAEVEGSGLTAWRPVMPEDDDFRTRCYADEPLVTQIAGTIRPGDVTGVIRREPTSSASMPSLVAFTLDQADLRPGHRVLELGTGTGWQAGLLCELVGEDNVFTVEADPTIARPARNALYASGRYPEVIEGDGRSGHAEGAPYDRMLATFGVARIYPAWLAQMKPGGVILANLRGRLAPGGIVRLTVGDDGIATGRFVSEGGYMPARQEAAPPHAMLPDPNAGATRPTGLDPRTLHNNAAKLVAESVTTGVQCFPGVDVGDGPADWFVNQDSGGYAIVRTAGDAWTVTEPKQAELRFWAHIESAVSTWEVAGRPDTTALSVTADAHGHVIHFP